MLSPFTRWLIWIGGCFTFAALLGLLGGTAPWRRWLTATLGGLALAVPFTISDAPVLRAAVALEGLWCWLKVIGIGRDPVERAASFRVLQLLVLHDLRKDGYAKHGAQPEIRLRLLLGALFGASCAALALYVALFYAGSLPMPWRWLLRHAAGLAFAYAAVEAALGSFEFVYRAGGLHPPILHQAPIRSRSLNEFWGRRWNRIVGSWLFSTFYRPLALEGRPVLGTFAAFAASGVLHFYFTWAAIGLGDAVWMGAFFVIQFPLLVLEQRLRTGRWNSASQRVWTLGWLLVTSPLFIEPMLRVLEGGF